MAKCMEWKVLEFADWANNKDYKATGELMATVFKKKALRAANKFYLERFKELGATLNDYADTVGDRHYYYGVSDDSFWDLKAHIIGLGEGFYNMVLASPHVAKDLADAGDYKENFGYIFHYMNLPKGSR